MAFDENGRLFVAELPGYVPGSDQIPRPGRVRVLEDTDGDGVFDSSTIYADNLPSLSAIACYGGGVFVATTPDILYLKDTKRDGIADLRKLIGRIEPGTHFSVRLCIFLDEIGGGYYTRTVEGVEVRDESRAAEGLHLAMVEAQS